MSLTVNNVNTLKLLNILNRTGADQSAAMTRLSTGQKINRGQDDPAGLLALKALESDLTEVNAAIENNQRTDAMLTVVDSSLNELSSLLTEIQSLAAASSNSAGLTASEIASNQSQIDDAIASIDRIVRTTEFNGKKLLDGSLGINVTGVDDTYISGVRVYNRDPSAESATVRVTVNSIAERAVGSSLATNSASEDTTIEIKGRLGTQIIEILDGESLSAITAKINDVTALTGVLASQAGGVDTGAINLYSNGYGSDEFVKVTILEGGAQYASGDFSELDDTGADAGVTVNGATASTDGNEVYYNTNGLSMAFEITTGFTAGTTTSFAVDTDGGARFQLGTDTTTQVTIGVDSLYSARLGSDEAGGFLSELKSGGAASLQSDPGTAAAIAEAAQRQVATLQGRLGGFQKYQVQTSLNAMTVRKESLSAVKSIIGDVDYAAETAELNRQNVLMQSAISLLGLANQQSQQVLSLL